MNKTTVFPSVFGRLFGTSGESASGLSLRAYRDEVLRDLRWLLNTASHRSSSPIHHYPHVSSSTLNFGMRDFAGVSASSIDPENVAAAVAESIRRYEPRIAAETLVVRVLGDADQGDRFTVEIIGDLWALPASEPLNLKTYWDVVGGTWVFE